jgi:ribonucleoside-diphosphate reductase beta chain
MFLDKEGPVTIQRYDDYAYPQIAKYDEAARGFFWVPEEITLTKDKIDFKDASKAVRHIFTSNLLRQTMLDSIQGVGPIKIFEPVASVPELQSLVQTWSFFEVIHSRSYSHIIRNIYNVPADEFNKIHGVPEIVSMAAGIDSHYDRLHVVNSKLAAGIEVSEHEHIKAIWMALIASYGLEAIRFMVSFATSLGMVENRIFIGNGNIISLILQDELLHTDWTAWLINRVVRDDPRFKAVKEEMKDEAYACMMAVIDEEKRWADYLFKEGVVIGLNANIMKSFVDWTAQSRLKDIGMTYHAGVKSTPIPWFNKHLNTSKKQTALQESESVSYILSSMTNTINYNDLPAI